VKRITNPSWLYPAFTADSILDIDAATLLDAGITHLIFDLDQTLVPRRSNILTPAYRQHLANLQRAGLTILIGTNSRRDITELSRLLGVPVIRPVWFSVKPRSSFYARLLRETGTTAEHLAMAGDHILNDVIGPNRAGFTTILVRALTQRPTPLQRGYLRYIQRRGPSITQD
jgi:hypothetical protein